MAPPLQFLAIVITQLLASFVVTSFFVGLNRTFVFLVVVPFATMLLTSLPKFQTKGGIVTITAATIASLAIVHTVRQNYAPTAFLGPFLGNDPQGWGMAAYGFFAAITILDAGITRLSFGSTGKLRRFRWGVASAIIASLIGIVAMAKSATERTPADILATIAHLEKMPDRESYLDQHLSVCLSQVGRLDESEAMSDWVVTNQDAEPISDSNPADQRLDLSQFDPLPWQTEMEKVAKQNQLIVIMEAHNAPEHRHWIEMLLPILHDAGFRDYAAEGLHESGSALARRGYPVSTTGSYVSDPCFGNLLRKAIELEFRMHSYEPDYENPEQREHDQAANLAKLFEENPNRKLVVHCGYAHAEKRSSESGMKMMAEHLWEMTGIEPYCIQQSWHGPRENDSRQLAELTGPERQPCMLIPTPDHLKDWQFQTPKGSFDALVVHPFARLDDYRFPRDSIAHPDQKIVRGSWTGPEWPVLIGAFRTGESGDAIALDQVMLRAGECDFSLCLPDEDYELRVYGLNGKIQQQPEIVGIADEQSDLPL